MKPIHRLNFILKSVLLYGIKIYFDTYWILTAAGDNSIGIQQDYCDIMRGRSKFELKKVRAKTRSKKQEIYYKDKQKNQTIKIRAQKKSQEY
jgi:hypothetical protein